MVYLCKVLQEVERDHEDKIGDDHEHLLALLLITLPGGARHEQRANHSRVGPQEGANCASRKSCPSALAQAPIPHGDMSMLMAMVRRLRNRVGAFLNQPVAKWTSMAVSDNPPP